MGSAAIAPGPPGLRDPTSFPTWSTGLPLIPFDPQPPRIMHTLAVYVFTCLVSFMLAKLYQRRSRSRECRALPEIQPRAFGSESPFGPRVEWQKQLTIQQHGYPSIMHIRPSRPRLPRCRLSCLIGPFATAQSIPSTWASSRCHWRIGFRLIASKS